jgi:hypothetical protein
MGIYSLTVIVIKATEMIESAYPWRIENGTNTVLHLKNITDKSARAFVLFVFRSGETYNPYPIVLEPYQSVGIDIRKLRDSKKRDMRKQLFPAGAALGQVFWRPEIPYSMIGRAEETNLNAGIASSFSCNTGCCSYFQAWISMSSDCNDHQFSYPDPATTFSSSAPSVASISSGGLCHLLAGGKTTITGTFHKTYYYWRYPSHTCAMGSQPVQPTAPVTPCTFTISPGSVTNAYCDALHENFQPFQANVIPDLSTCSFQPSKSSCTFSGTGTVHPNYADSSDNMTSTIARCTAAYDAGPTPSKGTAGTITFEMTLQLGQDRVTQSQTADVICR